MTLDEAALNLAADAVAGVALKLALHTGDPGSGAANEVAGGGYSRQDVTWDPASGGIAALSDVVEWDVPAITPAWVTAWNAAGTTRYGKAELTPPPDPMPVAGKFRLLAGSLVFA